VELNDTEGRLQNLEALTMEYPKTEYYSRILAIYSQGSQDDRTVMLNAYRLAFTDVGLGTVGEYLGYADVALVAGSPGEALRAMDRGMQDGVVPSVGTNQQTLQEAKTAVARDKKDLPSDAASAAKNAKGEVDVKVGLGYYSQGDWDKTVEAVQRGLAKGGVKRADDANMLLGASLVQLGKYAEAKAAFAAAAASTDMYMRHIAGMWSALADRRAAGAGTG
jgi:TolA-binding protein